MASVNKVILIGNLGKDPEVRYMPNGKVVASFSLACSESWKDKATGQKQERTEWINCTAFDKLAEICGQYLKKGSQIYVEGKIKTDKYQKDGQDRYSTKVVVNAMTMLGGKQADGQNQQQAPDPSPTSNFDDDEIPF